MECTINSPSQILTKPEIILTTAKDMPIESNFSASLDVNSAHRLFVKHTRGSIGNTKLFSTRVLISTSRVYLRHLLCELSVRLSNRMRAVNPANCRHPSRLNVWRAKINSGINPHQSGSHANFDTSPQRRREPLGEQPVSCNSTECVCLNCRA